MVDAMLEAADRPSPARAAGRAVDIVGTGGDREPHALNVSTMATLVVAGAGVPVCKHGNRGPRRRCGSVDLLEALGVAHRARRRPAWPAACEEAGVGFCFARTFHPAMRHAGPCAPSWASRPCSTSSAPCRTRPGCGARSSA